jgi:hypothetical protein
MSIKKGAEAKETSTTSRLSDVYLTDNTKIGVNISEEYYANLAWISVGGRDVFIDFLKAPGIIEGGIPVINGIRIYMPISAAMRLSEVLSRSIIEAEKTGEIEH